RQSTPGQGSRGNRRQSTTGQGSRATGDLGNGRQPTTGEGASGNRRQSTPGQGSRTTGGNLPLGRGLGQQAATYPWAGVSGTQRDFSCGVWPQHSSL
ncbi:unnamed protein product, partial [Staurois parvus]